MSRFRLAGLQQAVVRRPHAVLAASGLLVLLALALGTTVEFRTSRSELAPDDDADQRRWSALLDENAESEALIVALEASPTGDPDPAALRAAADRLALAFAADPLVASVFHRIDVSWFLERGLYLLPTDRLAAIVAALEARGDTVAGLLASPDLATLDRRIAAALRESAAAASGADEERAVATIDVLARLLALQRELLTAPDETARRLAERPPMELAAGSAADRLAGRGYPGTRDGRTLFLFVSPVDRADSLAKRRALVDAMRARAAATLGDDGRYRVAFTGQPAQSVEEMQSVRRDTVTTSLVAMLGVALLTVFVFRWRSHAFLVLAALAAGVIWSFGAVALELGYLNMITSSFISTLIGVGVAYGIHPVSEYELEGAHTVDPDATVLRAFRRTGPGVTVAAVTTSAAFFSILLMQFRGFAELGLVAGVGVLLCLLAATVTLPALLVVFGRRRQRLRQAGERRAAVVDRVWVERIAGRLCTRPWTTSAVALLLTAAAVWGATGLGFDSNIIELLPRDAESARYQRVMVLESDLSPLYTVVVARDRGELTELARRAAAEPTIARVDSALDFVPADPVGATSLVERLRPVVARLRAAAEVDDLVATDLAAACGDLEQVLADAQDDAFGAGLMALIDPLEAARVDAEGCAELAARATPDEVAAWNRAQRELHAWLTGALDDLRRAAAADPPTAASLPEPVRRRYFTRSGDWLALLMPSSDVFDDEYRAEYVAASRRVDPGATGFPVVFDNMARRITGGFYRAVAAGLAAVFILLLIDYRNLRDALLAMLPLGIGMCWMMGGMRLLGLSFNFANLVAIPLIIGVGIDNGVHVIHRIRLEGHEGMNVVLRHTGRAILIASLTTMIGFGSLALAAHRGIASLGLVLLLGVGACLVTATVVLPNLLVAVGRLRR